METQTLDITTYVPTGQQLDSLYSKLAAMDDEQRLAHIMQQDDLGIRMMLALVHRIDLGNSIDPKNLPTLDSLTMGLYYHLGHEKQKPDGQRVLGKVDAPYISGLFRKRIDRALAAARRPSYSSE